jgi:catechol 2,3-dioxygenase-like lactoylglutathione lyase family enzyme
MAKSSLAHISLLVRDYDEAIEFYTTKLWFTIVEDTPMSPTKRWVLLSPGSNSCHLLLAKAANEQQIAAIGNQTGGRVFLFLHTSDIQYHLNILESNNITIHRGLSQETYGKVLVFKDLYGNLWDLIEPSLPDINQ